MKSKLYTTLMKYIRATLAGGLLFLIPVTVCIFVVIKVFKILGSIARPVADLFPSGRVAGIGLATVFTIFLFLLVCLIAGLFMRTALAKKIIRKLEDNVLVYIPGYSYIRALSSDSLGAAENSTWRPCTIFVDDNEVLCFVIDETENFYSVFMPSAPIPTSGSVCVRKKENVHFLSMSVREASFIIRQFGKGGAAVLESAKTKNENFFIPPEE
ncbi:MAG: hypothetical protein C5B52_08580 [Bacteroidetes bacterium]|nr:MAG: hypothetical protein C5B52_08580 [Bacteroidota bacterium]